MRPIKPSEERANQEEKRRQTIVTLYKNFIQQFDEGTKESVYLNLDLVYFIVGSYFDDIYRYKDYSGSKRADNHKQAAYSIKWISKIRPIQLKESALINENTILINGMFAIFVGLTFLDKLVASNISENFYTYLLYTCQYREVSGKQMALSMYLLEKAALGEKP